MKKYEPKAARAKGFDPGYPPKIGGVVYGHCPVCERDMVKLKIVAEDPMTGEYTYKCSRGHRFTEEERRHYVYSSRRGWPNPGAAWHRRAQEDARISALKHPKVSDKQYFTGAEDAHERSEFYSRKIDIPNPIIGTCPLHGNPISVNPKAKRVRCPHGHTLRVPRR